MFLDTRNEVPRHEEPLATCRAPERHYSHTTTSLDNWTRHPVLSSNTKEKHSLVVRFLDEGLSLNSKRGVVPRPRSGDNASSSLDPPSLMVPRRCRGTHRPWQMEVPRPIDTRRARGSSTRSVRFPDQANTQGGKVLDQALLHRTGAFLDNASVKTTNDLSRQRRYKAHPELLLDRICSVLRLSDHSRIEGPRPKHHRADPSSTTQHRSPSKEEPRSDTNITFLDIL